MAKTTEAQQIVREGLSESGQHVPDRFWEVVEYKPWEFPKKRRELCVATMVIGVQNLACDERFWSDQGSLHAELQREYPSSP